MLLTVILSALAGAAVQPMQPKITELLHRFLEDEKMPDQAGRRVVAFCVAMIIAAIVLMLLGMPRPVVLMLVCGLIGYFQSQIRDMLLSRNS